MRLPRDRVRATAPPPPAPPAAAVYVVLAGGLARCGGAESPSHTSSYSRPVTGTATLLLWKVSVAVRSVVRSRPRTWELVSVVLAGYTWGRNENGGG